nr:uncharacterized protein LOC109155647 [Ipomoea trifida]
MYPYLDFFNEQENQEMEYIDDPEADNQDLRSHLNARMGSDRAHPVEPPQQDPVNVIHEVPVYPQATGPVTYQYPLHPMGVPDLNYPWWQGTPQYYPTPYQFPLGVYPQLAYVPVPETPLNPVNPELRRAQSERRAPGPYRDPSGPSRAPLPTQAEAEEAAEYESPRRRSAFDRLRRSARERLGVREEGRFGWRGGLVSGRRISIRHGTGGWRRVGHHAHNRGKILLVQGFLEGFADSLLHFVPALGISPLPVAPGQLFPDLLMNKRPEEGFCFLGVAAQEPGEIGVTGHLLVHLRGLPCGRLDLLLRAGYPSLQSLHLLGQLLVLRREALLQRDDVLANYVLRRLRPAKEVVRHVRELQNEKGLR